MVYESTELFLKLIPILKAREDVICLIEKGGKSIYHHGSNGDDLIKEEDLVWIN